MSKRNRINLRYRGGKGIISQYLVCYDKCTSGPTPYGALSNSSQQYPIDLLLNVATHVVPYPVVVQKPLDATHRTDCNILIPEFPLCEFHNVLFTNPSHNTFNFFRIHAAACGDDLPADVFGYGGGAVEGEQDGGFELRFGALGFGFGDVVGETRPFTEGKVDEIVDSGFVFCDQIDAPESTISCQRRWPEENKSV